MRAPPLGPRIQAPERAASLLSKAYLYTILDVSSQDVHTLMLKKGTSWYLCDRLNCPFKPQSALVHLSATRTQPTCKRCTHVIEHDFMPYGTGPVAGSAYTLLQVTSWKEIAQWKRSR
mmetsp:Transcript_15230/g.29256  ORF Transcript_15230/g.29256 Transcript_15230/m.29256 type:complete len:118 (+) Transcript_15230:2359-2712(+)